ncbi:MAG: MoaD/ThiS family protein [Flavisolibacter sp.]
MNKKINVLTFGAIADIIGNKSFLMEGIDSTEKLQHILEDKYPSLRTVQYAIAVNEEIIQTPVLLENNSTVAILPPFSGG